MQYPTKRHLERSDAAPEGPQRHKHDSTPSVATRHQKDRNGTSTTTPRATQAKTQHDSTPSTQNETNIGLNTNIFKKGASFHNLKSVMEGCSLLNIVYSAGLNLKSSKFPQPAASHLILAPMVTLPLFISRFSITGYW